MTKISAYTQATTLADVDLFDISKFTGLGPTGFETRKIEWTDIKAQLQAQLTFNNLYTADGALTGARIVTQGGNQLTFAGGGRIEHQGEMYFSGGTSVARIGVSTLPSATYKVDIFGDEASGHTHILRGRSARTTVNSVSIYGQANITRPGATQHIGGLFESVGIADLGGTNVAVWASAQNALTNYCFISPEDSGTMGVGIVNPSQANKVQIRGNNNDSAQAALVVERRNGNRLLTARNDIWVGVGNITGPLTAGTVFDVAGSMRVGLGVSESILVGNVGPTAFHIRTPAGYNLRFGASIQRENGGWWEWGTASGNYRFFNSGFNHKLLELQGSGSQSFSRWGAIAASGGTPQTSLLHEYISSYWAGGVGPSTDVTATMRHFAIGTAGEHQLEWYIADFNTPLLGVHSNEHAFVADYTVATLPSAAKAGGIIYVSDETGGATLAFSDGTNWRRVQDRIIVS